MPVQEESDGHGIVVMGGGVLQIRNGEGIQNLGADIYFAVPCGILQGDVACSVGTGGHGEQNRNDFEECSMHQVHNVRHF